ncbi:NAC domain containing protein [Melia azedarach]|uniref:NAC domain containing protein n=1 Tax=Melia azedarach TaxID=155640 RepID=A0ACC1XL72_MELAZ|nr:NAC domain containing protein [Melia azedarach]
MWLLRSWFFCAATLSRVISEMKSLPGFGFSPSNEQIIYYVEKKRLDPDNFSVHMIQEIDIYSYEPWDLPGMQVSQEQMLYIFSEPYYKYNNSKRAHRRTSEGYWKSTGEGSKVNQIGRKRILSFYHHGSKTAWVMHEFYLVKKKDSHYKKDFVLCLIKKKRDNKHGAFNN